MPVRIDTQKLKKYRSDRDLTQEELAKMAGVTRVIISKLENGYHGISLANLINITRALRVDLADITKK